MHGEAGLGSEIQSGSDRCPKTLLDASAWRVAIPLIGGLHIWPNVEVCGHLRMVLRLSLVGNVGLSRT